LPRKQSSRQLADAAVEFDPTLAPRVATLRLLFV
jgi:hypothetical protein